MNNRQIYLHSEKFEVDNEDWRSVASVDEKTRADVKSYSKAKTEATKRENHKKRSSERISTMNSGGKERNIVFPRPML